MKMNTDLYTRCPRCKTPINISVQVREAVKEMGHNTIPSTLFGSLYCAHCNKFTVAVSLQPESEVDKRSVNTVFKQLIKDVQKPKQVD